MIRYYVRHGQKRIYRHGQLAFFAGDVSKTGAEQFAPEIRKLDIRSCFETGLDAFAGYDRPDMWHFGALNPASSASVQL